MQANTYKNDEGILHKHWMRIYHDILAAVWVFRKKSELKKLQGFLNLFNKLLKM